MLDSVPDLTLAFLNEATQAWVELEYQRKVHCETGQAPLQRFLESRSVGRDCPDADALRYAFCQRTTRNQRRSDGTISLDGIRFEIPSRYRNFSRIHLRYASWDLDHVYLTDPRTGEILTRLYPLDRGRNADSCRRSLAKIEDMTDPGQDAAPRHEVAPLLRELLLQQEGGVYPKAVSRDAD